MEAVILLQTLQEIKDRTTVVNLRSIIFNFGEDNPQAWVLQPFYLWCIYIYVFAFRYIYTPDAQCMVFHLY